MRRIFITLSCLIGSILWAQTNDSIQKMETIDLEQTVISGQFSNQSVKKSIYEVKVISRDMIERQAGNNLADVLNQTLNMNIIPSSSTGKSTVSMFGLDGQYFKILIDNVPLASDEGLGNNTDLTQINLDDIQQIEIVEGAMGVDYGANAVAGIINIITKKGGRNLFDIQASLQEETIGEEYNWKNKGRHIQSLKIGHQLSNRIYTDISFSRNDFKGFLNDRKGKSHPFNDGKRGYDWLPKEQNSTKALIQYSKENYRLFYKFEYFNELVKRFDSNLIMNTSSETATDNPIAKDTEFTTTRLYHHLNASGRFNDLFNYDVSFSYQEQKKKEKSFDYWVLLDEKIDVKKKDFESREVYYSKGLISNFINKNEFFDFQFGYEINQIVGYTSQSASLDGLTPDIKNRLGSYDFFGSSELNFSKRLSLRPGARVMVSDQFDTKLVASVSAKYILGNDWEVRAIVGTAPRLPNYDEMYADFVDVNHNLKGNPDLQPEDGWTAFLHLKKRWKINDFNTDNKLSLWSINLRDKISQITIEGLPPLYTFQNIDEYQTHGVTYNNQIYWNALQASAGITVVGKKQYFEKDIEVKTKSQDFLYSLQFNASLSYQIPSTLTTFSLFYKYNGKNEEYIMKRVDNKNVYVKGIQDDYSWMDASIRQSFFNKKMDLTIGARNLFDVKRINTSTQQDGAHSAAGNSLMLGYGRSYFVKLIYNLSFN